MLAKQGPNSTDHAGAIGIFEHENDTLRACFHRSGIDANDSWSNSKKCAADGYIFSFCAGRKLQHVGIIAGRAQPRFGNFQSQTFGEGGCVYFIYFVSTGALQKTFEHGASDRGGIDFIYFSAVINVEQIDSSRRKLREEAAKFLPKTQMGPNKSERFCVECRHIDGIADCPLEQGRPNRLRDFDSNAFLRFCGRDRKSTRLNSSHRCISYAVFCLKKKIHPGVGIDAEVGVRFLCVSQSERSVGCLPPPQPGSTSLALPFTVPTSTPWRPVTDDVQG